MRFAWFLSQKQGLEGRKDRLARKDLGDSESCASNHAPAGNSRGIIGRRGVAIAISIGWSF